MIEQTNPYDSCSSIYSQQNDYTSLSQEIENDNQNKYKQNQSLFSFHNQTSEITDYVFNNIDNILS